MLTDEGLAILTARLQKVERQRGPDNTLTRASRASVMGVSIGTAARILGRNGNDKAVLVQVFACLGLPWSDHYCKPKLLEDVASVDNVLPEFSDSPRTPIQKALTAPTLFALLVTVAILAILSTQRAVGPSGGEIEGTPVHAKLEASRAAFLRGDYAIAEQYAKQSVELAKTTTPSAKLAYALSLEGDILAAEGRLSEAVILYKQALPFWDVLGKAQGYASLLESLGIAEARLGHLSQAKGHFERALWHRQVVNDPGVEAGLLRDLGSIAAVQGDFKTARKKYHEASQVIASRRGEAMHTDLRALKALLLRDEGKYDQALVELEDCLRAWQTEGHPRWVATTLFQIATVQASSGQINLAQRTLRSARSYFRKVGDVRGVQQCSKWLAGGPSSSDLASRLEEFF